MSISKNTDKPLNYKDPSTTMSFQEATEYLKKIDEWESVWRLERDIIIKWAEFLKKKDPVLKKLNIKLNK